MQLTIFHLAGKKTHNTNKLRSEIRGGKMTNQLNILDKHLDFL